MRGQRSDAFPNIALCPFHVMFEFLPVAKFRNRTKNTYRLSIIYFLVNSECDLILNVFECVRLIRQVFPVQFRLRLMFFVQVAETARVPIRRFFGSSGTHLISVLWHGAVLLATLHVFLSHEEDDFNFNFI